MSAWRSASVRPWPTISSACAKGRHHLGTVIVELGVDEQCIRQLVIVCEFEQAPGANAVSVIPPRVAAGIGLRMRRAVVVAEPFAEREVLDVEAQVYRQPFASRKAVIRAF